MTNDKLEAIRARVAEQLDPEWLGMAERRDCLRDRHALLREVDRLQAKLAKPVFVGFDTEVEVRNELRAEVARLRDWQRTAVAYIEHARAYHERDLMAVGHSPDSAGRAARMKSLTAFVRTASALIEEAGRE